ncbi:hypothetical protein QPK60_15065, partial [Aeromonas caviae]|nr:hypothetical protein [Aeromonas caviae]
THDEPFFMAPDDKHDLISGTCSHLPLAAELQVYIRQQLLGAGCKWALLSVSRTNLRALNHYRRSGWTFLRSNPKHEGTDFYRLELAK